LFGDAGDRLSSVGLDGRSRSSDKIHRREYGPAT
jgi:hypothetical protein